MHVLRALVTVPSLRRKAAVTIGLLAVAFALTHVQVPGVDQMVADKCAGAAVGGALGIANFFGGGALAKLTVGSVGVLPFITASIILILSARLFKPVSRLVAKHDAKFWLVAGAGTLLLTSGQAAASVWAARRPHGLLPACPLPVLPVGPTAGVLVAALMVAGTGAMLALGLTITRYGLGNGVSLLIAMGVLSTVPHELVRVAILRGPSTSVLAVAMLIALVIGLIWLNGRKVYVPVHLTWLDRDGTRPERSARRMPLPLNLAGVMPIILATIVMNGPLVLATFLPDVHWVRRTADLLSTPTSPWHLTGIAAVTIALTFYWVIITWDADQMAAGFTEHEVNLPDVAPGEDTARALDAVFLRATLISGAIMAVLAVLPSAAVAVLGTTAHFPLGGSSLLVMVAIGADTLNRIRSDISDGAEEAKEFQGVEGVSPADPAGSTASAGSAPDASTDGTRPALPGDGGDSDIDLVSVIDVTDTPEGPDASTPGTPAVSEAELMEALASLGRVQHRIV